MMRLIDADKLAEFPIRRNHCDKNNANPAFINGIETVMEYAGALPTIDAVPLVHGEWIEEPYLLGTTHRCNRCWENFGMPHGIFNYCPNCGAKMDGWNHERI